MKIDRLDHYIKTEAGVPSRLECSPSRNLLSRLLP